MKRFFGMLLAVISALLCLCGCGKKTTIEPITDGFTAQATIRYKEMDVKGQFTCSTDGRVTMVFTEPKSLDGVTLGWTGTQMQMQLGGMAIAVAEDSMPDGGLIRCLVQVLSNVGSKKGKQDGKDYVISGEAEGKGYTLVCDAETGLPKSLSVPDEQLTAAFSQVTVL
ncbi:MAG: hypothetical protein IJB36_05475 [Clostridia bacterium]|nr:hypothetical protein [Clostridia bacterium]